MKKKITISLIAIVVTALLIVGGIMLMKKAIHGFFNGLENTANSIVDILE